MVTESQARQMEKDVLQDGQRGPLLVKYFTDLLRDREERVAREAVLRAGLRELYKELRRAIDLVCREGGRLRDGQRAAAPPRKGLGRHD
jgi:hypothetical protein